MIAAQNGLIPKLPSKDQPKPKQDEIKDNKSLLREIILNSDNTEQDHFIKILLKKNKDGDTIITLAADTKYVTEFDAIISALQNKGISKDKITAILNTPNDIGYTALDIVLSHIENEPENIIDIEAAKKITNLLLNNGAEFSRTKIPCVEKKDITVSLNKLINDKPQGNKKKEEDTLHKTIIAAYSNNTVSQGSNSSSEKLRLSQAATPIKEKQQPNDVISATEFTNIGYEDMTSKPKNSPPAPPLLQSKAPHQVFRRHRHGEWQRWQQGLYYAALANGGHWAQRIEQPYDTGSHYVIGICV